MVTRRVFLEWLPAYILLSIFPSPLWAHGHSTHSPERRFPRCFYPIALRVVSMPAYLWRKFLVKNLTNMVMEGTNRGRV